MNNKGDTGFGQGLRSAALAAFLIFAPGQADAQSQDKAAKTSAKAAKPTPQQIEQQQKEAQKNYWVQYCEGVKPEREAYIAIDAQSGETLLARDEDAHVQIASMTKMMTLLQAAEAVRDKLLTLDTPIPPEVRWNKGKDGKPITSIVTDWKKPVPLRDMMLAAFVGSKNDAAISIAVAVAKARGIGNTEADFVKFMNKRAEELKFDIISANASGLPLTDVDRLGDSVSNERKASTPRTVAMIMKHIRDNHPDLHAMMEVKQAKIQGKPMNHTLRRLFDAVNGMIPELPMMGKSGFTCRSGFGAAVTYGNVILSYVGAQTPDQRKDAVAGLLKQAVETQAALNKIKVLPPLPQLPKIEQIVIEDLKLDFEKIDFHTPEQR